MSQETKRFYEFDRFRIDMTERVLLCEGEMAPLPQKAFEVLLALIDWSRDGDFLACVRGLWATNVVLIKDFK